MRALALLMLPLSLQGAEQWIKLTTPHFEMYTSASQRQARETILYFEEVRSFFQQASETKNASTFPVRIIAFRGEKQYRPYRINEFAAAFYTGSHERDYIVMGDISADHYPVAIHEYTHLIIQHSGLPLPPWMNEGWAELYSTLRPAGNKAIIGEMQPGRLRVLSREKWLPIQTLTGADHQSPYYNEKDKAGVFYAESWALMHMLYFGDRYRANFNKFVVSIATGVSFAESCQAVYGYTAGQVEKDLKLYFTSRGVYSAIVPVKLTQSEEEATVTQLPEFQSKLVLADLLAVTRKTEAAKEALTALAAQHPGMPEVDESLGYLAWQSNDLASARQHFAKAIAEGTRNPQLCYQYALLERSAKSADALRRAVMLKPDFIDAWLQLSTVLTTQHDYPGALAALDRIQSVPEAEAARLFNSRAFLLLETGKTAEARKNALDARKWAKTPRDADQAKSLLDYLDRAEAAGKMAQPAAPDGVRTVELEAEDTGAEAPPTVARH